MPIDPKKYYDLDSETGRENWVRFMKRGLPPEVFKRWELEVKPTLGKKGPLVSPPPRPPGESFSRQRFEYQTDPSLQGSSEPTEAAPESTEEERDPIEATPEPTGDYQCWNDFISNVDLDYRPASYGPEWRSANQAIAHLTGLERRHAVRALLRDQPYRQWQALMAYEELTEDEAAWAQIRRHLGPRPDYEHDPIEIAHLTICSTLGDWSSVAATRIDSGYRFRILSSSDDLAGPVTQPFSEAPGPLSMRELIDLIDRSRHEDDIWAEGGLVLGSVHGTLRESTSIEEAVNFVKVDSAYYPELGEYYRLLATEQANEVRRNDEYDDP